MNQPMNSSGNTQDSLDTQKKKKIIKAKSTNGTAEGTGAKRGRKKKVVDEKKCTKKKFGKKGVTVTSQAREIVYNVIKHFKVEAQNKCNSHPFDNWLKRSVAATGLSKSTLQRIIKEVEKPPIKIQTEEVPHHQPQQQAPPPPQVLTQHKEELPPPPLHNHVQHHVHNGEILVSQTLEAVRLEQYEQGLIKHFTSNFMHHNLHHHHNMTHPDLMLQPIHHAPIHQPPPHPPPTHSPLNHHPHTHIHS